MDFDSFIHNKKMKLGQRLLGLNGYQRSYQHNYQHDYQHGYQNTKTKVNDEVDQLHRMRDRINEKQAFIQYLDSIQT